MTEGKTSVLYILERDMQFKQPPFVRGALSNLSGRAKSKVFALTGRDFLLVTIAEKKS